MIFFRLLSCTFIFLSSLSLIAQPTNKGKVFGMIGLNWAGYTASDISLKGEGYDFKLENVIAGDLQTKSQPQYIYRFGYYFNDNWSVSGGLDHMKYVVRTGQETMITGSIDSSASPVFAGNYTGQPITITEAFLHYEHTDGLNYVSIELDYTKSFFISEKHGISLDLLAGPGLALMIPRTDVTLFGSRINNNYHVSGIGGNAKIGTRLNFFKYFFMQADLKGGYITMPDVLVTGKDSDRAKQSFAFAERIISFGLSYKLSK